MNEKLGLKRLSQWGTIYIIGIINASLFMLYKIANTKNLIDHLLDICYTRDTDNN